jgi:secreted trypsin-like serine protease
MNDAQLSSAHTFVATSLFTLLQSSSRALVVNGEDAVRGRYPYFVTLQHYGAGALIAPDIVLSAGHCRYVTLRYDTIRFVLSVCPSVWFSPSID